MNQANVAVDEFEEISQVEEIRVSSAVEYDIDFKEKKGYEFVKRAFDIVASLLALIALSPVFIVVAGAIFFTDFGNPFFVQERIGKNGK